MLNRNSNTVLWLGVLAVMAFSLSAYGTAYNFPNSSMTNQLGDPTVWQTVSLPHTAPTTADFLNPANTWNMYYKQGLVASGTNPGASFTIAGPLTFHGGVGVSGTNYDRPLLFNGNTGDIYDRTATFSDLRFQGTMRGEVTRRIILAGNIRFIADANGNPSPIAIQVRTAQQLNITAQIDAADCPSINIIYNAYLTSTTADSQISLRNANNKIYSKFVLDSALYGYINGALGDADVEINGAGSVDYRAGKLILQSPQAISTTAKVSVTTATGMNTDPVRINVGTNNVTIRELWVNGTQVTGTTVYTTANAPTWLYIGTASPYGSLTVTNTPTQNLTMAVSPSGDPNLRIFPPVGTKAYAQGYVVNLSAPSVSTAGYIFNHWASTGATVANALAANTTVTMPVGSDVSVTAYYDAAAYNPSPVNTAINVSNFTGLSWMPAAGSTAQTVYFGTVNPPVSTVAATGNTVTNADLGGRLADSKTYYWRVDSTIGGNVIAGQVWSFTTANSVPNTPSPAMGAVVPMVGSRLNWTEAPTAGAPTLHSVYFSTDSAAVAARTAATIVPDANGWYNSGALVVGKTYYWAVDSTYQTKVSDVNTVLGVGTGPTWSFAAQKNQLFIKTEIAGYNINGTGDVNGVANNCFIDDANVVIYKFPTFNYNSEWNIVVSGPKMFAIWSDAGITIGGELNINGYYNSATGTAGAPAHAGPNAGCPAGAGPWLGTASISGIGFGGQVINNISGAGAGYGSAGGRAGRFSTVNGGAPGIAYGQLQMFDLFAGSGGGGGKNSTCGGGAGGGGAVELYAKAGNVDIQSTALITANGGSPINADYPSGAGSGGGIRIIASNNVTMAGTITANGGKGGNCTGTNNNNTGGGGAGGRIAIYKGGSFTQTGTITATGGACGINTPAVTTPPTAPTTFAKPGGNGTIYTSGVTSTLQAAYNQTPADGVLAYSLDPNYGGGKTLSWNPALGTTQNKVYLSTVKADVVSGAPAALKTTITAKTNSFLRARKTYTPTPALVNGTKYYWRVDTNGVAGPVWSFTTGTCSKPAGDLNADCKVTFADFAIMASQWGVCNLAGGTG